MCRILGNLWNGVKWFAVNLRDVQCSEQSQDLRSRYLSRTEIPMFREPMMNLNDLRENWEGKLPFKSSSTAVNASSCHLLCKMKAHLGMAEPAAIQMRTCAVFQVGGLPFGSGVRLKSTSCISFFIFRTSCFTEATSPTMCRDGKEAAQFSS